MPLRAVGPATFASLVAFLETQPTCNVLTVSLYSVEWQKIGLRSIISCWSGKIDRVKYSKYAEKSKKNSEPDSAIRHFPASGTCSYSVTCFQVRREKLRVGINKSEANTIRKSNTSQICRGGTRLADTNIKKSFLTVKPTKSPQQQESASQKGHPPPHQTWGDDAVPFFWLLVWPGTTDLRSGLGLPFTLASLLEGFCFGRRYKLKRSFTQHFSTQIMWLRDKKILNFNSEKK